MTGNGGTGQLSGHWTTVVGAGTGPPMSQATTNTNAVSATAMSSALILDVKRAPLPTGRPKLLGARFRSRLVLGQPACRSGDVVDAGQISLFQDDIVGHRRHKWAGDPQNRRVKILE